MSIVYTDQSLNNHFIILTIHSRKSSKNTSVVALGIMTLYCSTGQAFHIERIILMIIAAIIILSIIPITYKFVKSHLKLKQTNNEKWKKKKQPYYIGLVFIAVTTLSLLLFCFGEILGCKNILGSFSLSFIIYMMSYLLQTYCLLLLSFVRIYKVFKNTSMKLSKCITRFYKILFLILAICIPLSFFILIHQNAVFIFITVIAQSLTVLLWIFLGLSIMILFIHKLIQVYKLYYQKQSDDDDDSELIGVITRLCILTLSSILFTFFIPIAYMFTHTNSLEYIYLFATLIDIATNFWLIMLTFDSMNGCYSKLCGCINSKCQNCWMKRLEINIRKETAKVQARDNTETAKEDTSTAREYTSTAKENTEMITTV